MSGETRHITIERRVRYAILPGRPGRIREVWFGLHGYNQLAPRFLRRFSGLDDGTRRIIAPEGLHRQYIDHATRKVGASWMTSEDRLTDIGDYVAYLDRLHAAVLSDLGDAADVRIVALGFSQGVHTLCRWIAFGTARIDRAILWGATVPPDLDLEAHGEALSSTDLQLVVGNTDEFFDSAAVESHEARLRDAGVRFRSWSYAGGHRLHGDTLAALTRLDASGSSGR